MNPLVHTYKPLGTSWKTDFQLWKLANDNGCDTAPNTVLSGTNLISSTLSIELVVSHVHAISTWAGWSVHSMANCTIRSSMIMMNNKLDLDMNRCTTGAGSTHRSVQYKVLRSFSSVNFPLACDRVRSRLHDRSFLGAFSSSRSDFSDIEPPSLEVVIYRTPVNRSCYI